ncbi:MAG: hypothetical protein J3Q66DRAFT_119971 [Benniella sp.]|nr:MAG: hypothetical protein J3Q66DRAFT_119971 [Benniella sp.]
MNQDEDTAVLDQGPPSPESDASTVSDPESPPHGSERSELDEQRAAEELATIQEELQSVLEYVDQGMVLKSFDTLCRLTDIAVTNCDRLGLTLDSGAMDQKAGFWTGLNNCWLFAFSHYGNARSEEQQLKEPHLHHLYNNVKAWADALEKYGLVNYELGFWEQDILEAIEVCLTSPSLFIPSSKAMRLDESQDEDEDEDEDDEEEEEDEDEDGEDEEEYETEEEAEDEGQEEGQEEGSKRKRRKIEKEENASKG